MLLLASLLSYINFSLVAGLTFLILVGTGVGVGFILLVILICCCCCKCCCKKAPKHEYVNVNAEVDNPQDPLIRRTNTPRMDQRREELYEKYNIKRNY